MERVRKKRNVFERAASAFEKADQVQKTSRRFIQSTMESGLKCSTRGRIDVGEMMIMRARIIISIDLGIIQPNTARP